MSKQTLIAPITTIACTCNRPHSPDCFFCFPACRSLSLCFPVASPLSPQNMLSCMYFLLRESVFCLTQVPANKVWRPAITERAQRSVSSKLAAETVLLYLLSKAPGHASWACSNCSQASTPVPDQRVCRRLFSRQFTMHTHRCISVPAVL